MKKRASALTVILVGLLWAQPDSPAAQTAQEKPRTDRLTLDMYLEMETVSEPSFRPTATRSSTRGAGSTR
jgi:hypothetical protein